ncbi:MAG: hypothetical protein IKZ58_03220 [Selenomonadaceae bacterium]|nr:hypothetical protein [Selenomonadaceae bacterium]
MNKNFLRNGLATIFALVIFVAQFTVSAADINVASEVAKTIAAPYYARAKERAKTFVELRAYSDHGEHHAELVAVKSQEAADAVEKAAFGNPSYSSIDRVELEVASFMHDTGMDGGTFKDYTEGNSLRKDHPLNSAIHVLENRDAIAALGVNPDMVAVDCMGHSKSTSGIRNLTSHEQWTDCFNRIDAAVELYNKKYPNNKIYFDKSYWTTGETFTKPSEKDPKKIVEVYVLNREMLARTASTVSALRLGDANREESNYPYAQTGAKFEVDFDSYVSDAKDWKSEITKAKIFMIDENGKRTSLLTKGVDDSGYDRMYRAGEGNLLMSCAYNSKTRNVCEIFKVIDGKSFPLCTQKCIEERLEELDTMKNLPVEAHIIISGNYSARDKNRIAKTYEKYCKDATRKHQFSVTFEFKAE